jgi:excinuclease ABC subunit C
MLESLLDDIPKLGEARRTALLAQFGSVSAIRKASVIELAAIPGIGPNIAESIFTYLSNEPNTGHSINMETGEIT